MMREQLTRQMRLQEMPDCGHTEPGTFAPSQEAVSPELHRECRPPPVQAGAMTATCAVWNAFVILRESQARGYAGAQAAPSFKNGREVDRSLHMKPMTILQLQALQDAILENAKSLIADAEFLAENVRHERAF